MSLRSKFASLTGISPPTVEMCRLTNDRGRGAFFYTGAIQIIEVLARFDEVRARTEERSEPWAMI